MRDGKQYREIAKEVALSKSTIACKINQYKHAHGSYNPVLADFINGERARCA